MLDKDTENFMNSISETKFSAYDFLSMFCAIMYVKGNKSFYRDSLISFIELNNTRYANLLNDIKLRSNGIFNYSDKLDEAYSILKWCNVLYTISPELDSLIYIEEGIPVKDIITLRSNYYCEMESFVNDFIEFTRENGEKKEESAESEATKGLKFVK